MADTNEELGAQVKAARQSLGWGQNQLAKHVGASQATVSRIEAGEKSRSLLVGRAFQTFVSDVARGALKPEEVPATTAG